MRCRGLIAMGVLVWSAGAYATDAGVALAQRSVCLACHQVDVKRVGPSFRDIAIRYSTNAEAAAYLARSIRDGSRGLWGAIPMPAQRHVDPATALLLGEWIVSLAPRAPEAEVASAEAAPSEDVGKDAGKDTEKDASEGSDASVATERPATNPGMTQ